MMAMLRRHRAASRSIISPFVLPSYLTAITPWLWPSTAALVAGALAHVAWLAACEWLAPAARAPAPGASSTAVPASRPLPQRPPAFTTTTVLAILDETPGIRLFRLARPDGFDFAPGQFLPVRVRIDGTPHVRCYSICSAPHARGYLEIGVRRQGLVSGALHATLGAGSQLAIGRPSGAFVYPEGDDRPLVLIAGGIGITPLLAMLRHAVVNDPARPVTLLYSARSEADLAFLPELRLVADRHPRVGVAITVTQPGGSSTHAMGRIDGSFVRRHVADPAHSVFCLCGPLPMIDALGTALAELGVPASQVRSEQFDLAVAASQVNAAVEPAVANRASVSVTFAVTGLTVAAPTSQSLLETAESQGVEIPSVCRSGVCQSCRTRLAEGEADCRSPMLDPTDRDAGFILPCVTYPRGDCVMEA